MASRRKSHTTPDEFASARRALERWRKTRLGRSRIPEPLWATAVRLARKHGVNPTARELGLDYYSLKNRLNSGKTALAGRREAKRRGGGKSSFVELPLAGFKNQGGYAVVLESANGAKLRFEFDSALDVTNLKAIARALLDAAQ